MPPRGRGRGRGRISDSRPETPVDQVPRPRSRSSDIGFDDYDYNRQDNRNYHHNDSRYKNRGGGHTGNKDFRSSNRSLNYNPQDNYDHYNRNDNFHRSGVIGGGEHRQQQNEFGSHRRDNNKTDVRGGGGGNNNKKRHDFENRRKSDNSSYGNIIPQQKDDTPFVKSTTSVNDRIQNRNMENLRIEENPSEKLANMNFASLTSISPNIDGHFDWSEEVERATSRLEANALAAAKEEETRQLETENAAKALERNFNDSRHFGRNQHQRGGNQSRRNRRLVR